MKYPFYKKSFWIILSALSLLSLIISFAVFQDTLDRRVGALSLNQIFVQFIFVIAIAFVADYLGHLIFSKPEKK